MTSRLWLTRITHWGIEVAPFSDLPNLTIPINLSSPSQHHYIEVGMVMMSEKGVPG
jgi:hypothetical protein